MKAPTSHADKQKTAIGYIRVSTYEQVQDGVSLDAQRDRLRAYCKTIGIKLIGIYADEGISGGTMERPGLQTALRALARGRADTLVVTKIDRLTRSVKDLCTLVEDYFAQEKYDLVSVCGMVNTHTAAGRMMMMNLANYAQYERELISERVREAMQHMKAQGVRLGVAPYGYRHSHQLDDNGRRVLEPVPAEQEIIKQIIALRGAGHQIREIAALLNENGVAARRGGKWYSGLVSIILEREGAHQPKRFHRAPTPIRRTDKDEAATEARTLRSQGLSLREIGRRLRKLGLVPPRGGEWHAATVLELLTYRSEADPVSAAEVARKLRDAGHSLRQIALLLMQEGHLPPRGGRWHAASVSALLHAA